MNPSTSFRRFRSTTLLTLSVALLGAAGASAQPPETPPEREPSLGVQHRTAETEPASEQRPSRSDDAKLRKLEAKAAGGGAVPVIVGLKLTTRPDGALDARERKAQREAIKRATDETLDETQDTGASMIRTTETVPFLALHATEKTLRKLRASKHVATIVEDEAVQLADDRSPAGTSSNSWLANWWDHYRTATDKSWANGYTGSGQMVAVLDTGVDRSHSYLSGAVVNEACFATTPNGGGAGACPNGRWSQLGYGAARACTYHSLCAHGTHVAGIAAGTQGVASKAQIMAIQVFRPGAGNSPTYNVSDLTWAMDHVYKNRGNYRIAAVNMSLGDHSAYVGSCDSNDGMYAWIQALRSAGIPTVIASGNDGYTNGINHPACTTGAVSVGNATLTTSSVDAVYSGSNQNASVSLLAPGTSICSSIPGNQVSCGYTGTSMAAPQVAGALAALRQLRPTASVTAMVSSLQASGVGVGDYFGRVKSRINVWNAINHLYTH